MQTSGGKTVADELVPCPCCATLALGEEAAYEVCPTCGWEDDPVQREQPDYAGGANGVSLHEARKNWREYGQAFPPSEAGV